MALGLTIVDNLDGTWHYPLPSGASTSPIVGNNITWVYDGQQNYPCVEPTHGPTTLLDGPDTGDNPTGGRDKLPDAIMTDNLGRRWRVDTIDHVAIDFAVADYWADVDASIGLDLDPPAYTPPQEADTSPTGSWTFNYRAPTVYLDGTCSGNALMFGSETRSMHNAASLVGARSAAARVERFSSSQCGGALVDDNWVLTAAHCVDEEVTANELVVRVGASTRSVQHIRINRDWTTVGGPRNDFAVLQLASAVTGVTPMVLSRDGQVAAGTRHLQRVSTDASILVSGGGCTHITTSTVSYHPGTEVRGTKDGTVRLWMDSANGSSGGPLYRVKAGQTVGRILGVMAGTTDSLVSTPPAPCGSCWAGGARVSEFKDFVIAHVTD